MKSAKKCDIGDLKRMTPEQRAALYENARRSLTEGGKEVIDLLDSSGLPLSADAYFHRSCVTDRHRICMRWHRGSDYL